MRNHSFAIEIAIVISGRFDGIDVVQRRKKIITIWSRCLSTIQQKLIELRHLKCDVVCLFHEIWCRGLSSFNRLWNKQLNFYHNVFVQLREMHCGCLYMGSKHPLCIQIYSSQKRRLLIVQSNTGMVETTTSTMRTTATIFNWCCSLILNRTDWYKCVLLELKFKRLAFSVSDWT